MLKVRFATGIALLAISATGCALAGSPRRNVVVPAEPTMIDYVDPATVAGLSVGAVTVGDSPSDLKVHISYPLLPDARALTRALRRQAQQQLRDFLRRTKGPASYPRPELNVDWQLPAASSEVTAVRLRTGERLGADWGNSMRTLWFDPRTGATVGSTALLKGKPELEQLTSMVKEGLRDRGSQIKQDSVKPDEELLDSMAFNRSGDLVVEFDDCQIGPCSLGRLAVAVPRAQAAPLLSDLGRRAQTSVLRTAATPTPSGPPVTPRRAPDLATSQGRRVDCSKTKCVALTFDDGPGPYTGRLLDVLREQDTRATFFVVGANAAAQPQLLRRMSTEGHLVASHSWSHRDLSMQGSSMAAGSLRDTSAILSVVTGQSPRLVRPPYGAVSQQLMSIAYRMGLSLVTWDVNARDDNGGDPRDIAGRVVRQAHPGAIILMHDIHRHSVDAVPDVITRLRAKGYTFVTVPELYGAAGMQAGRLYRSGSGLPGKRPLT
ncbi:polysaccharide deacetylase family protein [Nonomuraea maritima]|uniref:polysaccharide deacetylase family protein n=1 Tax=Nonomuraea maritima TaxID=683260 RepID=UPI0037239DC4